MDVTERQYLHAVFCLSRAGKNITLATVAATARLGLDQAALATIRLGHAGLIDGDRLRLTMRGLAMAARMADLATEAREAAVHTIQQVWPRAVDRRAAS